MSIMASWVKSGQNEMTSTWVDGEQVVYLLSAPSPGTWQMRKKVVGAASKDGYVIGLGEDPHELKKMVEWDMSMPL